MHGTIAEVPGHKNGPNQCYQSLDNSSTNDDKANKKKNNSNKQGCRKLTKSESEPESGSSPHQPNVIFGERPIINHSLSKIMVPFTIRLFRNQNDPSPLKRPLINQDESKVGGGAQFHQAGILIRLNHEHWIKTRIEVVDGIPRLSCVIMNGFSD